MKKKQEKQLRSVLEIVSEEYNIAHKKIFSESRATSIREPRQIFHYLCVQHTYCTLEQIGDFSKLMGREEAHSHATIINSVRKIKNHMEFNPQFYSFIKNLETRLINKMLGEFEIKSDVYTQQRIAEESFVAANKDFISKIKKLVSLLSLHLGSNDIDNIISWQEKRNELRQQQPNEDKLAKT